MFLDDLYEFPLLEFLFERNPPNILNFPPFFFAVDSSRSDAFGENIFSAAEANFYILFPFLVLLVINVLLLFSLSMSRRLKFGPFPSWFYSTSFTSRLGSKGLVAF